MRRLIAGIAVALAIVGVVAVLHLGTPGDPRAKRFGDAVTVVLVAPSVPEALPIGASPKRRAPVPTTPSTQDAPILHALALPAGTPLRDVVTVDAAQHVVCGEVAATPTAPGRRFVYLGMAGLAAIDDGGPDFAPMSERLCRR